jgi:GrpB-like predicted nucleotidyltransferase (UPF0157 family)
LNRLGLIGPPGERQQLVGGDHNHENLHVGIVEIVEYDPAWPAAFFDVGAQLRRALGDVVNRIDHIGSTSVPGLASKDIIDIQVTVAHESVLSDAGRRLADAGWRLAPGITTDHAVPGWPSSERTTRKVFLDEPPGLRRVHVHVRVLSQANQRYALLFRDYLPAHPNSASAYRTLKKDLAALLHDDSGRYADVKDAACDLIYFAAEAWAVTTGWVVGASDA